MKTQLLLLISILFFTIRTQAQCPTAPSVSCNGAGTSLDLYWVGTTANNSGNWNTPCSWRVGSTAGVEPCQAPRSIDNVFFTNTSFAGTSGTGAVITINTIALCNNFFVDPNVSTLTGSPAFSLNNPGFMEVYGSFTLQAKVTWTVVGAASTGPELFFKATTLGKTITTNGKVLGDVKFDGIGGGWSLQDNFNAGSVGIAFGNFSTSDGVNSYTMNLQSFALFPGIGGGTAANRIIKFNNSIVNIAGVNTPRYSILGFRWNADNCTTTNTNFSCGGSIINLNFGSGNLQVTLGALTYNVINHTGSAQCHDHNGSGPAIIDTLTSSGSLSNSHSQNINVLLLTGIGKTHTFNGAVTVNTDFIATANLCNPLTFRTGNIGGTTFAIPASVTADPMVGYRMINIKTTPAHTYTGWKQGTTTGWTVIPPTSRNLYWVGTTSTLWSNPVNWSASPTGVPLLTAGDCPPTLSDDVYFTAPLLDAIARPCSVNVIATCHNMTWTTATANARITGAIDINVSGNITFVPSMTFTNTSIWLMVGNTNNTIFSAGKKFNTIRFTDYSTYELLDDLNFGTKTLYNVGNFNANGYNITGGQLNFTLYSGSIVNYSNSIITLSSNFPWVDSPAQSTVIYNAASRLVLTNTTATTTIDGGQTNATLYVPDLTVVSSNTTLRVATALSHFYVRGNLTINGNAGFYGNLTGGPGTKFFNITVAGNLNLAAGKIYEFGLEPANTLTVNGTVNSIGTCANSITIKGINGNPFRTNFLGATNFDFTNIANSTAITPITVSNCVDNGGNTNWTFNPPATTYTYYWRASATGTCSPCVYNGNWSTGDNWSTNPLAIQGNPGCMPSQYDNVVFDNMSWNGTTTTNVTVSSNVSFNNITATSTKTNIVGTTAGSMTCAGNVTSDGTLIFSTFLGQFIFGANTTGKTINFGGIVLGGDIVFNNANGGYTVVNSFLRTATDVYLNAGTLNTNGRLFGMRRFKSSGTALRTLNLGSSTMTMNGSGNGLPASFGGATYTWDTQIATNFTFNAGTSTVSIDGNGNLPKVIGDNLTFYNFNCTGSSSALATCPLLNISGWNTKYMKLSGSAIMYGNNAFDTLEFTAGKIYKLENNRTQTLKAPNGILMATGTPGNEISIKGISVGGTPAKFRKLNTGGALTYMCFDYLFIEDNFASSDDPGFKFYTGVNSNNISATGIWDLSLALFYTPTITAAPDLNVCPGAVRDITFNLAGSGPFIIKYTIGGGAPITLNFPFGTTSFTIPNISHYATTAYTITSFKAQTCAGLIAGTVIDGTQMYNVTPADVISTNNDVATCNLNNENQFVHFYRDAAPRRPICSIADDATGTGLGTVTATVQIDATVQTLGNFPYNVPYLQRRFGITPTSPQLSTIRLYFTQAELTALSTKNVGLGRPAVALVDLMVTKFDNNVMDFTGGSTLLTVTNRGAIPAGITTSTNVYFVEVVVSSYSHFIIHPPTTTPLPIELLGFTSKCTPTNTVQLNWKTASETNNNYFNIEKSNDGLTWESIAKIIGAGNSTTPLYYTYNDKNTIATEQYYRLKQTDFDGRYTYSDMLSVTCTDAANIISVFPNPNDGNFTIHLKEGNSTYELYNSIGQLISTNTLHGGQNAIQLNDKANGVYLLLIRNESQILYKEKLIIESGITK